MHIDFLLRVFVLLFRLVLLLVFFLKKPWMPPWRLHYRPPFLQQYSYTKVTLGKKAFLRSQVQSNLKRCLTYVHFSCIYLKQRIFLSSLYFWPVFWVLTWCKSSDAVTTMAEGQDLPDPRSLILSGFHRRMTTFFFTWLTDIQHITLCFTLRTLSQHW